MLIIYAILAVPAFFIGLMIYVSIEDSIKEHKHKNRIFSQIGTPHQEIIYHVWVNPQKRLIAINDNIYHYSDILKVNGTPIKKSVHIPGSTTTTTDTGNMAKRAIVGGVIAGPLGAAVGAATAKQTTNHTEAHEATYHTYKIKIKTTTCTEVVELIGIEDYNKLLNFLNSLNS